MFYFLENGINIKPMFYQQKNEFTLRFKNHLYYQHFFNGNKTKYVV